MKRAVAGLAGLVAAGAVGVAVLLAGISGPPPVPPASLADAGPVSCTVDAPKGGLNAASVAAIAYRAGWRGQDVNIAVAVARAESGWNAKATNTNTNSSVDYGLFQINSIHAAILAEGNWADPADNAEMAFKVWKDAGGKWSPWVTFWRGTYKQYLEAVPLQEKCTQHQIPATCDKEVAKGYGNGQIPARALCPVTARPGHRLRADAANRFNALTKAYNIQFGAGKMCLTDSYRSYAAQVSVFRRKPGLAAIPGTSNHGWGMAADLCSPSGGSWVVGSEYDEWMHVHAPKYGWVHPDWAHAGGSKPEPWHWECRECGAR